MTTVHERVLPFTPSVRLDGTSPPTADGSGDPVAVPGMPSGPRSLLVSCGVDIG